MTKRTKRLFATAAASFTMFASASLLAPTAHAACTVENPLHQIDETLPPDCIVP